MDMIERVARAMFGDACHDSYPREKARKAIEEMQKPCFECGEPVTLVCLACQKTDS